MGWQTDFHLVCYGFCNENILGCFAVSGPAARCRGQDRKQFCLSSPCLCSAALFLSFQSSSSSCLTGRGFAVAPSPGDGCFSRLPGLTLPPLALEPRLSSRLVPSTWFSVNMQQFRPVKGLGSREEKLFLSRKENSNMILMRNTLGWRGGQVMVQKPASWHLYEDIS